MKHIGRLRDNQLIQNDIFKATEYGSVMAKNYLKFETMCNFVHLPVPAGLREILLCLCKSQELADTRFHKDKGALNNLKKHPDIRFKASGKVSSAEHKIDLLIQSTLGCVPLADSKKDQSYNLTSEANIILGHAKRVGRALVDIFAIKNDFTSLLNAIYLERSLRCGLWENTKFFCRQIDGIGPQMAQSLVNARIRDYPSLMGTLAHDIESV